MSGKRLTWEELVCRLRAELGRAPTLHELMELSIGYEMTPEELEAQRRSWARANVSTGDPEWD